MYQNFALLRQGLREYSCLTGYSGEPFQFTTLHLSIIDKSETYE